MLSRITRLFPLWAILLSTIAFYYPGGFIDLKPLIIPLLAFIMFCMGLTLTISDFTRTLAMPKLIILGLVLQFSVMPLTALALANLFGLSPVITSGMVLVGTSPGGTASNVVTYLAKGNVALSITLTALSTVMSVLLTPLLTWLLIDNKIDVPMLKMFQSIITIVFIPVLSGLLLNHFFNNQLSGIKPALPLLAVIAIVLIIAIITALNHSRFYEISFVLLLSVILHNATGFGAGYLFSSVAGYKAKECRTVAIEVGMQNSGLAVALAIKYFSATAALPGAIFSIWHNIAGSLMAWSWSRTDRKRIQTNTNK